MASPATYSFELELFRATKTTIRQKIAEFIEAVTGSAEVTAVTVVAPGETEVISLGGITTVKAIFINGKIEGGTDNVNLMALIQNVAGTGVTAQTNEVRFGSHLVILDAQATSLSIKNLDTLNAVTVEVRLIGE